MKSWKLKTLELNRSAITLSNIEENGYEEKRKKIATKRTWRETRESRKRALLILNGQQQQWLNYDSCVPGHLNDMETYIGSLPLKFNRFRSTVKFEPRQQISFSACLRQPIRRFFKQLAWQASRKEVESRLKERISACTTEIPCLRTWPWICSTST